MAKRIVEDIATPRQRSIRDIKQSDVRSRSEKAGKRLGRKAPNHSHGGKPPHFPRKPRERGQHGEGYSRLWLWTIAVAAVVIALFALSTLFAGSTVDIVPTQATISLDETSLTAEKNADSKEGLPFRILVVSDALSREVPAAGEKHVERKASGEIIIYNAYSSRDQRLIPNTRFEAPDGRIYRIPDPVVVPGTRVEGGEVIPGSVEVKVYADAPGEEYNKELTDFTIPGFKGDPRYESFYARSKTSMTGGFTGTVRVIPEEDAERVRNELRLELKQRLLEQAFSDVPEDFILYSNAAFFSFTSNNDAVTETTSESVTITEEGTLRGALFDRRVLSRHLADQALSVYDGSPILVRDLDELDFSAAIADYDPTKETKLPFTLSGTAHLVWQVNTELLKTELVGIEKDAFPAVVEQYTSIKRAEATVRPFWASTFPEDEDDISVRINIDE